MQDTLLFLIPTAAPAVLFLYCLLVALRRDRKSFKSFPALEYLAGLGILVSLLSAAIVYQYGTQQSMTLGWEGIGFALRLDSLSTTMLVMIAIMGYTVIRFSKNYLDGDPNKNVFMARMATTIASVELLVLSGNLGQLLFFWILTSVCLHYLLVFYRARPQAVVAARKKFISARLGDLSLSLACLLIYLQFGTGDFEVIFSGLQEMSSVSGLLVAGSVFMVIAAGLKSAQFPMHGWLIEVVETPTPVSALLHAGLLNAGPFLMVRMSYLMTQSTTASLLLIAIGGFTAMYASVVYMTQPTIKVSLGYSSIAHMGFSLLLCGFGVYGAALLHVVAHSFYKAHAFLSSGSVIDSVRARKVMLPGKMGNFGWIMLSLATSFGIFAFVCYLWGIHPTEDFNLMATGAIIVMGLSQVISSTLDAKGSFKAIVQTAGLAVFVSMSFFSLEFASTTILGTQIPAEHEPPLIIEIGAGIALFIFSLVVMAQLFAPKIQKMFPGYKLGIHIRNGLYVNMVFDRMIGSLKNEKFKWANLAIREEKTNKFFHTPEMLEELKTKLESKVLQKTN